MPSETVDYKKELKLDKMIDSDVETIRYEYSQKSQEEHLARLKEIRATLGKRFKAVVDVVDHTAVESHSGSHVVFFKVQK